MPVDDSFTKALLHFNGVDASTTFTDESGKTWTARGNAQIDTAQSKFGGSSYLSDGTTDWIDTPDSADFDIGAGDFTFDFWVRFNSVAAQQAFFSHDENVAGNRAYQLSWNNATNLISFAYTTTGSVPFTSIDLSWTPSTNTWYHVEVVRSGNNFYIFIDGTQIGTTQTLSATIFNCTHVFQIGVIGSTGLRSLNGWIDEFRFSKGIARHTANFTPPTSPYKHSVSLTGAMTITGALIKSTRRGLSGSVALAGSLVKQARKTLLATIALAGTLFDIFPDRDIVDSPRNSYLVADDLGVDIVSPPTNTYLVG